MEHLSLDLYAYNLQCAHIGNLTTYSEMYEYPYTLIGLGHIGLQLILLEFF